MNGFFCSVLSELWQVWHDIGRSQHLAASVLILPVTSGNKLTLHFCVKFKIRRLLKWGGPYIFCYFLIALPLAWRKCVQCAYNDYQALPNIYFHHTQEFQKQSYGANKKNNKNISESWETVLQWGWGRETHYIFYLALPNINHGYHLWWWSDCSCVQKRKKRGLLLLLDLEINS